MSPGPPDPDPWRALLPICSCLGHLPGPPPPGTRGGGPPGALSAQPRPSRETCHLGAPLLGTWQSSGACTTRKGGPQRPAFRLRPGAGHPGVGAPAGEKYPPLRNLGGLARRRREAASNAKQEAARRSAAPGRTEQRLGAGRVGAGPAASARRGRGRAGGSARSANGRRARAPSPAPGGVGAGPPPGRS